MLKKINIKINFVLIIMLISFLLLLFLNYLWEYDIKLLFLVFVLFVEEI